MELLLIPFVTSLLLVGIHGYLGFHIVERGVIFVDLALAQIAALGYTLAFWAGHPLHSQIASLYGLGLTVLGAGFFAATRGNTRVPQEAIIGISYVVSAAAAILVVDRSPQGAEHIKQILNGSILAVSWREVLKLTFLYGTVALVHWIFRRCFLLASLDPEKAREKRMTVPAWDFWFYLTFGVVVTSSVPIAGVLLVFSYLIIPAVLGAMCTRGIPGRLWVGWVVGGVASTGGLWGSFVWDLPPGPTMVCALAAALLTAALARGARAVIAAFARNPQRSLWIGAACCSFGLGILALSLIVFPRANHWWLALAERTFPALQRQFLSEDEREILATAAEDVERGQEELKRLKRMQMEVTWGERRISREEEDRLRQYIVGRTEIVAGDRMTLRTIRDRARTRQRFALGIPLFLIGIGLGVFALRKV